MDVSTLITILVFIFGASGFTGGLVGYFAKGRADSIIKAQAQLISTRDQQLADQEKTIVSLKSENKILTEQNNTLKGLAQGAPQLADLTKEIKKFSKVVMKLLKEKS